MGGAAGIPGCQGLGLEFLVPLALSGRGLARYYQSAGAVYPAPFRGAIPHRRSLKANQHAMVPVLSLCNVCAGRYSCVSEECQMNAILPNLYIYV